MRRIYVSYADWQRLTPELRQQFNVCIDFTRGGDWARMIDAELDYAEEAEANGMTLNQYMRERR